MASARHGRAKSKARATRRKVGETNTPLGLRKASLFMNGRSQAVRLPKEFRFAGSHVFVRKSGNGVILSPTDDRLEYLLAAMGSAPGFPDRDQGLPQERPELDEFFK